MTAPKPVGLAMLAASVNLAARYLAVPDTTEPDRIRRAMRALAVMNRLSRQVNAVRHALLRQLLRDGGARPGCTELPTPRRAAADTHWRAPWLPGAATRGGVDTEPVGRLERIDPWVPLVQPAPRPDPALRDEAQPGRDTTLHRSGCCG